MSKAKWLFVLGSAISLGIGFIADVFFEPGTGVLAGLVAESIVAVLAVWLRVTEVEERVTGDLARVLDLVTLHRRVAQVEDPLFTERYNELLWDLRELSEGKYELRTLEEVYADDARSIDALQAGDVVRSVCPLANSAAEARQQITNRSYVASMRAHINAAARGVRVIRMYSILDPALRDVSEVIEHFNELAKEKIDVRVILASDPRFRKATEIDLDFVVFGTRKVSIGKFDPRSPVVAGALVDTNRIVVERYVRDYEELMRISEQFVAGALHGAGSSTTALVGSPQQQV